MKEVNLRQGYQVGHVILNGWKGLAESPGVVIQDSPKERKCFPVPCFLFWSVHPVTHDFSHPG